MADNFNYLQVQKYSLQAAIAAGDTSITLQSMKLPDGSTNVAMADLGATGYGTLEPGTSREESISFTGITQNGDGTATLTGVTRGLDFTAPYTTVAAYKKAHSGGTIFVISNTSAFYNNLASKENEETINQVWTYAALPATTAGNPVADNDLARKAYVDTIASGNFPSDRIVWAGTAGETIADGDLIYFDTVTNNEWMKCDADTAASVENVVLGIAQGAGVDGGAIANGVLIWGVDDAQSGMTIGEIMYASNTAGDIANSAGTTEVTVGIAKSATELYFYPRLNQEITEDEQDALAGTSGTPSNSNKYVTNDDTAATPAASKIARFKANSKLDDAGLALTTAGDVVYSDGTDLQRLGIGTAGQAFKVNSGATAPEWANSLTSDFAVGTGNATDVKAYYTYQLPWHFNTDFATGEFFTSNGTLAPGASNHVFGYRRIGSSSGASSLRTTDVLWQHDNSNARDFVDAKTLIADFWMLVVGAGTNDVAIGFGDNNPTGWETYNDSTIDTCMVTVDSSSNIYAKTSDAGVGATTTAMTGLTIGNWNNYRIEWDGSTPNAKFYVNGVLKQTLTTNLPNGTGGIYFGIGFSGTTTEVFVGNTNISIEI